MGRTCSTRRREIRRAYKIFVGNPESNITVGALGKIRRQYEGNTERLLKIYGVKM